MKEGERVKEKEKEGTRMRALEREVEVLRQECDTFTEDNLKLLLIIKEHNLEIR